MSEFVRKATDVELLSDASDIVDLARNPWQYLGLDDIRAEMTDPDMVDSGVFEIGDRAVRYVAVNPEVDVIDETSTLVLSLPYLNTWDDHHYIRAKVLQQLVAPNSTVIVLPNNAFGDHSYRLTDSDRERLKTGDIKPISELHMRFLEKSPHTHGALTLTGYSFGGRNVLGMAAVGSDTMEVNFVNADEIPSKHGRTSKELKKDFMKSGSFGDLRRCVKESEIPALSQSMNLGRMSLGIAMFGLKDMESDSKITREAMTGSIEDLVVEANQQLGAGRLKVGSVAGSRIFEVDSLSEKTRSKIDCVEYSGELFHGHASGDNVILHGLMVRDGLINR